jgi:hypothetical protein
MCLKTFLTRIAVSSFAAGSGSKRGFKCATGNFKSIRDFNSAICPEENCLRGEEESP